MVLILYFHYIDMHYTNIHYGWPTLVSNYFFLLNLIFNIIFNLCFRLSSIESIGDEVNFILHRSLKIYDHSLLILYIFLLD